MAQTVLLKRSSVAGNVPGSSDLALGEIAVNTADGAVYIKKGNNDIVAVADNDILHIDTTNGRVGIGTTSPSSNTLTVDGDIRIRDSIASLYLQDSDGTNQVTELKQSSGITTISSRNNTSNGSILFTGYNGSSTTQYAKFDNTGKFGIGTTSPDYALDIRDDTNIQLKLSSTTTTNNARMTYAINNVQKWNHGVQASDSSFTFYDIVTPSTPFKIEQGAANNTLVVDSNSRVGIGINNPSTLLHLQSTDPRITLTDTSLSGNCNHQIRGADQFLELSADTGNAQAGSVIKFSVDGSERARITSGGNVGIGTTSPDKALTISASDSQVRLYDADGTNQFASFQSDNGIAKITSRNNTSHGQIAFQKYNGTVVTESMRIDASGNVGIGDSAPQDYLEINGSGKGLGGLTISNSTHNHAALSFARSSTATARIYLNEPDATHTGQLNFQTSNASGGSPNLVTAMVIDENQNVGIGTTSPTDILTITGDAKYIAHHDGSRYAFKLGADSSGDGNFMLHDGLNGNVKVKLYAEANAANYINNGGNFGIGTSSPAHPLHVSGSVIPLKLSGTNSSGTGMYIDNDRTGSKLFGILVGNIAAGAFSIKDEDAGATRFVINSNGSITFNQAYTFPTSDGSANQVLQTDGSGNLTFATVSGGGGSTNSITDADGDTKIQVEESTDEDKIRFDAAGTERMRIGSDVQIIGTTDLQVTGSNRRLSFTVGTGTVRTTTATSLILATNSTTALTLDSSQVATFANHVRLADSKNLQLGSSQDFQLYHNGTNSYVRNYTGNLDIINEQDDGDIAFYSDNGSGGLNEYLRIDGGADRTVFSRSSRHQDGVIATFGTSEDLQIYHDGSNSYIDESGTGGLILKGGGSIFLKSSANENMIVASNNGAVTLYYDNSAKIATTSTGVEITGNLDSPQISINDYISHNGDSNTFLGFDAADTFSLVTGGTTALSADANATHLRYQGSAKLSTAADGIILSSSDATGAAGPVIDFNRDSASPADADYLGQLKFRGENDADQDTIFAKITAKAADVSDGTEDGAIEFTVKKAGSNNINARLSANNLDLINGTGLSVAGNATITGNLTVNGTQTTLNTATLNVEDKNITLNKGSGDTSGSADGAGITIQDAVNASTDATLTWNASTDSFNTSHSFNVIGDISLTNDLVYNANTNFDIKQPFASQNITFHTTPSGGSATERMRIKHDGNVGIGTTNPIQKLQVAGNVYANGGDILLDTTRKLIWGNSQQWIQASNNGQMKFIVNNGERVYFQTDGRIETRMKKHFRVNEAGNLGTTIRYYKIATVNKGNSGITIKGTLANHVESFGTCKFDLAIFGREDNNGANISVNGTVEAASANSGVRIVKQSGSASYINYDVYIVVPKYCHADVEATIHGNTDGTGNMIDWHGNGTYVTTAPTGAAVELNTSTLAAGHYNIIDSAIEMSLTPTGLGIGTTAPANLLHVNSGTDDWPIRAQSTDAKAGIIIQDTNTTNYLISESYTLSIGNQASLHANNLNIKSTGNVGIGKTSPTEKLDIVGNIGLYGELKLVQAIRHANSGMQVIDNDNDTYFILNDPEGSNRILIGDSADRTTYFRNDTFRFQLANGTEKMRLKSNGFLGIGTDSPLDLLHLKSTSTDARQVIDGHTGFDAELKFAENGTVKYTIGHDAASDNFVIGTTNVDTGQRLVVNSAGKVGIGTDSPYNTLHVNGTSRINSLIVGDANATNTPAVALHIKSSATNARLRIEDSDSSNDYWDFYVNQGDGLHFQEDGADRVTFKTGGNVGIGTTSPNFPLHINKGTSSYTPTSGVNENVFGINTSGYTDGRQGVSFSRLDGNWIDGTSGTDTAYGWVWSYENNVRGGLVYDHRGSERMQLFSSYGALGFITPNAADGNGVPTDSNMVERLTILAGGDVGIGTTTPTEKLHIAFANTNTAYSGGSGGAWGSAGLKLENSSASANTRAHIHFRNNDSDIHIAGIRQATNDSDLGFFFEGSEKVRFTNNGNVGINKIDPKAKFQVEEYGVDTTSTASSATTQIAIHSFAAADFRSARFTVQVTNSTDSTYHTTELLLVHNGTTANITEFGEIHTGSAVEATFDADISSGYVRLLATPASTDTMAFKVVCHSITT